MDRKGTGYASEIGVILVILVLFLTFYVKDSQGLMPLVFLIVGVGMLVGGMSMREPLVITGGIGFILVAVVYAEVVL